MNIVKTTTLVCLLTITALGGSYSAKADAGLLGCDPKVLEKNKIIKDALDQVNAEIAKASITQPTPVELMTCADQQMELINKAGNIHANPSGDINSSMTPFVKTPMINDINNFLSGASASINSIANAISTSFSSIVSSFTGSLGGLSVGDAPTTDCDMMEQTWLLNQCMEVPEIPSLSEILNNKATELTSVIGAAADPERYIEQVCNAADSKIKGYFGDLNKALDDAASDSLDPIMDKIP